MIAAKRLMVTRQAEFDTRLTQPTIE